ncbi:MAG: toxin [Rickettsiales bacterium]|nr:toxin [Rickettsiales bacterium]
MNLIIEWSSEKNDLLKKTRNMSFEDVEDAILNDEIIDIIPHHNQKLYPNQEILIVRINNYVCYVPFVIEGKTMFLKTIIPSRKFNKKLK